MTIEQLKIRAKYYWKKYSVTLKREEWEMAMKAFNEILERQGKHYA